MLQENFFVKGFLSSFLSTFKNRKLVWIQMQIV